MPEEEAMETEEKCYAALHFGEGFRRGVPMKLREVVKLTGLTKRTIYFYIEENFLSPEINPRNGYYIFSKEDVVRLKLLQQLRKADFSIKDIHEMLKHPASAYIYVRKQTEALEKEREMLNHKIRSLQELYERLPILVSGEALSEAIFQTHFPDNSVNPPSDSSGDASLVSLYLWGPFLNDITMTEYRKYLWGKLVSETEKAHSESLQRLKKYVYSLSAEELDREFILRAEHIEQICSVLPEEIPGYIRRMERKIAEQAGDQEFLEAWKREYRLRVEPTTKLYDSEFNGLVSEMSPRFSQYYRKIHRFCDEIYAWVMSEEGRPVKERILKNLEGYIDLCADHHGQIAALFGLGRV